MDEEIKKSGGVGVGAMILVVILVAVAFGGLGYWLGTKNNSNVSTGLTTASSSVPEPPIPTLSQTTTSETAGWKTYMNDRYGYSIKYPSTYSAKDWASTIKGDKYPDANKDLLSVVGFGNNSKLADYEESVTVTNDTLQRRRNLACYGARNVSTETETTIGGVKAYKKTCEASGPNDMTGDTDKKGGEKIIEYTLQNGNYVYIIEYIQTDLSKDTGNIFDQMVSTFQFSPVK